MKLLEIGLAAWLVFAGGCASSSSDTGPGRRGAGILTDQIMSRYDTNRDNRITAQEASAARFQQFDRMDIDRNGLLTASEAKQLSEGQGRAGRGGRMAQQRGDPFLQLDTNADGSISRSEFESVDAMLLTRADLNADGAVERSEIDALLERMRGRSG